MNGSALPASGFREHAGKVLNPLTALLTTQQMVEADRLTVVSGITSNALMENAGRSVADEIVRRWTQRPVIVLCGPGSNGGDGFVVARLLAEAKWPVRVALLCARNKLFGPVGHHAALWQGLVEPLCPGALEGAELVVDAIFGAGLSRPLEGAAAETLTAAAARRMSIIAVDVPSGLMGDTGVNVGAVAAVLTVTYFRKMPGHLLQPGRMLCGEVVVADIGTPSSVFEKMSTDTFENNPALWAEALPRLCQEGNKYSRGHALVSGGYPATGAARMAARAAARAGAGLTTVAVSELAFPVYAASLTSVMVSPATTLEDFSLLLADRRYTALLIGPGAGTSLVTSQRVLAMLKTRRAVVLDADALSTFADDPSVLFEAITGPCVLTPHDGEFARLFDVHGDKLTRTRAAARKSGAIIVLKGSDTVVAAPDGRAIINANAPPNLATAGAGDVLGGIVLGLLAQGMDPFLAAAAAVWLHGDTAAAFGPGLLAEDLPDLLPGTLRRLQEKRSANHFQ
jgi:ADP-dependent NAD(P)H-hydrate dehydratase / NAD(P)H-hydrate epimerase